MRERLVQMSDFFPNVRFLKLSASRIGMHLTIRAMWH